ncbi:MAG: HAMP domain-containing sensor histidine kinase [Pirellulales bacterium]
MTDRLSENPAPVAPRSLDTGASLESVLAAWHSATVRLEQTHEALRAEVARLTSELEVKNRELARKNRLADLGQMASHIAHEVRNNLVPVNLYLSLMRRRLVDDPGGLDVLAKIEGGFTALDATVNDLLSFTSRRDPHWERFDLQALVQEVYESLAPQLEAQEIEAVIDVPDTAWIYADRDMLRRALLNLALNALDAMPEGGTLETVAVPNPAGWELEVADSGEGLSEAALRRAFEPFYTTKRGGTGLGLAVVMHVAEAHSGSVQATNCPEGGAAFTLKLPNAPLEAAA